MSKNKNNTKKGSKNMPPQGASSPNTQPDTEAKKAMVYGSAPKNRMPVWAALVAAAVLIGLVYYFIPGGNQANESVAAQSTTATGISQVELPLAQFDDGKARFYAYPAGDLTIKYFVLKSSDGVIRAAFDACDVCWPAGKGYYQDGDVMVCRNCGRRFASVQVNVVQGGCNPAPLHRRVEGGNLVINVADILTGKRFFDFSGRV